MTVEFIYNDEKTPAGYIDLSNTGGIYRDGQLVADFINLGDGLIFASPVGRPDPADMVSGTAAEIAAHFAN